jgi:poly-gamma-glutamate biosynthesis protein PgsC/CapC
MLTAALVAGVAVSLLLVELLGVSAGGLVTPGYVALLLDRPAALAGLAIISGLSFGTVRLLGGWVILFGSRRFAVTILAGLAYATGLQLVSPSLWPGAVEWAGLGFIVPGLIAHQFERQGILPTLLALVIAAPLVRVILVVVVRP